ncbi:MAG: Chemotaxis protein methyltransferase [Syntrophorhabdus sp. PtaU1.Bin058]|nr:MAG: Chemotaxis protein methyltransferase [Syntrophorhabdus sp. PtaU1.Bin058]
MMNREEFVMLRDFIYEKTGIYFTENKMYLLESRLTNRLQDLGLSSYEDYYYSLKFGGEKARNEINNLFDVVTTNETSFFRNPPQLDVFKMMVQKGCCNGDMPGSPIKIWSAACSTGEEPYTLAIIVLELVEALRKNIPFMIYGTDISAKVLESAKRGVFNPYSIRNTDDKIMKKYFTGENNLFALKEQVKRYVKIDFMNLMEENSYRAYRQMDFIFCRNVLIYFDEKMKKKVIDSLYECLKPKGILIIGHAESLHNISRAFKPLVFPGTIAYQRG